MKNNTFFYSYLPRFLIYFISFILLTSCKFSTVDNSDIEDPGSTSFLLYGEAPANSYLWNLTLYDTYAFASDGENSFSVYDILSPTNPTLFSTFHLNTGSQAIKQIKADWNYNLYIAAGNGGISVINCSNPISPTSIYNDNTIYAGGLDINEAYIAVINNSGWRIYYITTAYQLNEVCNFEYFISKIPRKVKFINNWLFVLTDESVDIFDVSNFSNPSLERSININRTVDFDIIENYLTVITDTNLYFINISSPLYAEIDIYYELEWFPISIDFKNQYMFISWSNRNVSAYRINSINSITEIARKEFSNPVYDMGFSDNYLYFANGLEGLKIYNFLDF